VLNSLVTFTVMEVILAWAVHSSTQMGDGDYKRCFKSKWDRKTLQEKMQLLKILHG